MGQELNAPRSEKSYTAASMDELLTPLPKQSKDIEHHCLCVCANIEPGANQAETLSLSVTYGKPFNAGSKACTG